MDYNISQKEGKNDGSTSPLIPHFLLQKGLIDGTNIML